MSATPKLQCPCGATAAPDKASGWLNETWPILAGGKIRVASCPPCRRLVTHFDGDAICDGRCGGHNDSATAYQAAAIGDQGEADTTVECHSWTGPAITVGLAHQRLRDALTCLSADFAVLTFTNNPGRPFLLRPADEQGQVVDDGYGHVLMPMRLSGVARAKAAA